MHYFMFFCKKDILMRHYYIIKIKDSQQFTKKHVSSINKELKNNFGYLFVMQIAQLQFKNQ